MHECCTARKALSIIQQHGNLSAARQLGLGSHSTPHRPPLRPCAISERPKCQHVSSRHSKQVKRKLHTVSLHQNAESNDSESGWMLHLLERGPFGRRKENAMDMGHVFIPLEPIASWNNSYLCQTHRICCWSSGQMLPKRCGQEINCF